MIRAVLLRLPKAKTSLLAVFLGLLLAAEIVFTCLIPQWRTYFYDIMESKNASLFTQALVYFTALMGGLGVAQGLKVWAGQLLSFEFRKVASKILLKKWVKGNRTSDNYTAPMTSALQQSTELYVNISAEVVISLAIVVTLIMSNLHNHTILWSALIYTVLASLAATLFNKPLTNTNIALQTAEGKYREAISDIANGNGDYSSKKKFIVIIEAYYKYIATAMYFRFFTLVKSSLSMLIPYILMAPQYFSGSVSLGDFMAAVSIFELIVLNSTILVVLYPQLISAKASYKLTADFYKDISR